MSSSSSPCAACKFLRRKCTQGCVFSPYFPPDQPTKFANVHHVFGASNVAKLLNDLPQHQREDAVISLAFEAQARLQDPVNGCMGHVNILQARIKQVQMDIYNAKKELASYMGPAAFSPFMPPFVSQTHFMAHQGGLYSSMGGVPINVHQQQQYDPQHIAAMAAATAAREQEMLIARMNEGGTNSSNNNNNNNNTNSNVLMVGAGLGLGPMQFDDQGFNVHGGQNEVQQQQQMQMHHLQAIQSHYGQHQRARSDEGRSG